LAAQVDAEPSLRMANKQFASTVVSLFDDERVSPQWRALSGALEHVAMLA